MMNKQTVYDLKPEGKVVYIRVDYNVPHDKRGIFWMTAESGLQFQQFIIF